MTVVVEFKELGQPAQVFFGLANSAALGGWTCEQAEQTVLDAIDQVPWGLRAANDPDAVRIAGRVLRDKLATVEPLQKALVAAFAAAARAPQPLYFRVGSDPRIEAVPFEAVWDSHIGSFACLDPRWPIARMPADAAAPAGPFTMERVVRIAAVLAAEGLDPSDQVAALRSAAASQPGLNVEVTILTSDLGTMTAINNPPVPGWSAELVPATADALIVRLREVQPHLLHIFCHGTADGPRLLIAQLNDLAVLELGVSHFAGQPGFLAPWLVTLNCCEGAAPGVQTGSLASGLVRSGMPAVLGMRKAIDKAVADDFCADLYRVVLARLAEIARRGRAVARLDWAALLHEPRRRLCAAHGAPADVAGRQKEWTIPVLYLATPDAELRGMPTADLSPAEIQHEIITLDTAASLEANGNLSAELADQMRAIALARLYPEERR